MSWLQRLLLIDSPEHTSLHDAELSLRGLLPFWLAIVLLVAAAAGVLVLYLKERGRLNGWRRGLLTLLRTLAFAILLALLLRPVLLAEFHGERPRPVVLLLDNSQSLQQRDRRLSDAERIRAAIAHGLVPVKTSLANSAALSNLPAEPVTEPERVQLVRGVLLNQQLNLLDGIQAKSPLQTYFFGRRLGTPREVDATLPLPKRLASALLATDTQTALADSVQELLNRTGADLPAALFIVTDGRDNASRRTLDEAAEVCKERGVPLYIYGVGTSQGGVLLLKEVIVPRTMFVDEKPEVKDDPIEVPVRWKANGFKEGTVVLTLTLGDQVIRKEYPVKEGDDFRDVVSFTPEKGKEGNRNFKATIEMKGQEAFRDEVERQVQVRNSRVKVLYVENLPRREYKFIQPVLDRDRRVLSRFLLIEGDPRLAEAKPDPVSGSMFLDKFPENFPDPSPTDPDKRPYDLLILGDVPPPSFGAGGERAVQRFVKEGGGLVVIAGGQHCPAAYVGTPLAEVLPVEFVRRDFRPAGDLRTEPYKPTLSYDGEQSHLLALADGQEENLRLWKEDLWKDIRGFYWHYPVTGLRPGATALLVHPQLKIQTPQGEKPMPLAATHFYGKGEVLFLATDETWRLRFNVGDKLTARFWGQIVAQLGLPHLLGSSSRVQLELERTDMVLGRPATLRARLLDARYDPLTSPSVPAKLEYLEAKEGETKIQALELKAIRGQPGEYRATLPNDRPGRFELKVEKGIALESATLPYRVDLPPHHELEIAPMAEESLRAAAAASGGKFYREEDLYHLVDDVAPQAAAFVQRQEILLWNPAALILFVLVLTGEWLLRKFSNLS